LNCPRCRRHLWYEAGLSHPPKAFYPNSSIRLARGLLEAFSPGLETGEGLLLPQVQEPVEI